ncbi:MAG TPA: hypothetical protein VHD91_11660, partial [Gaiellaceae bacterium]|nr:hypothetical protein [Gaiellaceae bacterium]
SAWFGALGSVAIGFHGVFEHGAVDKHGNSLWSGRWPLWYAGRPFSGMLTGVMTYVLLRVASGDAPDLYVTIAAAFIFGTQENLFFRFLSRIAKVIVSTDEPHAGDS